MKTKEIQLSLVTWAITRPLGPETPKNTHFEVRCHRNFATVEGLYPEKSGRAATSKRVID
jgi:hypothetical protein